jgi:hypothetical protein
MSGNSFYDRYALSLTWAGQTQGKMILRHPDTGDVLDSDKIDLASRRSREQVTNGFASHLHWTETERELFEALLRELLTARLRDSDRGTRALDWIRSREEAFSKLPKAAIESAEALLLSRNLIREVMRDFRSMEIAGEWRLSLAIYCVATSRLLPKPLHAILRGVSSSGKSFVPEQIATLLPPGEVIHAHDMTPQALFYMHEGGLKHRFVLKGERTKAESLQAGETTKALREMMSSGFLSKLVPIRLNGSIQSVRI